MHKIIKGKLQKRAITCTYFHCGPEKKPAKARED